MTAVCSSTVNNDTHKLVLIVTPWLLHLLKKISLGRWLAIVTLLLVSLLLGLLLKVKVFLSVLRYIDLFLELIEIVELNSHHSVEIKLKSLESHNHVAREILQASTLQSIDFLFTLLTHVLVRRLQHVSLHESIETFIEVLLVHHRHANVEESFLANVLMWASLADDLICECTAKVVLDCLFLRCAFDCVLETVHEHVEVLLDVHLLYDADWFAFPILEGVAVSFGVDIHLFRKKQSCKEALPLEEHVVLVRVLIVIRVFNR
jgi:hypothetical protein